MLKGIAMNSLSLTALVVAGFSLAASQALAFSSSVSALSAAQVSSQVSAQASSSAPSITFAEASQKMHKRLFKLFAQDNEASLERNPLSAIFRGDLRYADRLGDFGSDAYNDAERAAAEENLRRLSTTIDRTVLNASDSIAYDVFAFNQEQVLMSLTPEILALTEVRPVNHFSGLHTFYPNFASGQGAAPFKTRLDYENNLRRHTNFVAIVERAIARFKQGQESGIVETKLTITNVIAQLDTQLALEVEDSPYWGPILKFPDSFDEIDKAYFAKLYRASIAQEIYPSLTRLRDYLRDSYLADARAGVGLIHMKGGATLYQHLIEDTTTLKLTADEIHDLGLTEVARITAEMEKVRAEVGFKGPLTAFFDYLRSDPQFQPESRESLTQGYYDIGKTVKTKVGAYFATLPKAPLEIRPYEAFREKYQAGGSYQRGTPDGSRAGVFYFNAYDLPSRTTPGMTTLYLHEGAPGHHFQISLAQENTALPAFMRFGGNTAYVEGWALYSETLGYDMGLFANPYQRFGTLSDEMLRAMRLVVDTGLHAKGWERDQAIDYMMANSDMGRTDATAEVERYIAIPSQALAYKIGALTIQRLRDQAKDALGDKFDIRQFHEQVLGTGALPLAVLEKKINDWIATQK